MQGRDKEVERLDFETEKKSIWDNSTNGEIRDLRILVAICL